MEHSNRLLVVQEWLWNLIKLEYTQGYKVLYEGFPGGSVVKNVPAKQEMWVRSLGWVDPLEKEMATHSSILVWKIPQTEEPGGLQSRGLWKSQTRLSKHRWDDSWFIMTNFCCMAKQFSYTECICVPSFFIFLSVVVYHGILNIVPCVI